MFLQILNSLPKQIFTKKDSTAALPANMKSRCLVMQKENLKQTKLLSDHIMKLAALGFETNDCVKALELCEHKLDDAALWLTQNAIPAFTYGSKGQIQMNDRDFHIKAVEVRKKLFSTKSILF